MVSPFGPVGKHASQQRSGAPDRMNQVLHGPSCRQVVQVGFVVRFGVGVVGVVGVVGALRPLLALLLMNAVGAQSPQGCLLV